jgi:hypothetical protein
MRGEAYDLIQGCESGPAGRSIALAREVYVALDHEKTRPDEPSRSTI